MDLLYHFLIVSPLLRFLLNRDRTWNKKHPIFGSLLGVTLLLFVCSLGFHREPNLYELLEIQPLASPREVQSAYRRMSKQYHPDVNSAADSHDRFQAVARAQNVLVNPRKRKAYHRFGDFFAKRSPVAETIEVEEFTSFDSIYVVLIFAAFRVSIPLFVEGILSIGSDNESKRHLYRGYLVASFSIEILLRYSPDGESLFSGIPVLGKLLPFEQINAIQALSSAFLNIGQVLQAAVREDELSELLKFRGPIAILAQASLELGRMFEEFVPVGDMVDDIPISPRGLLPPISRPQGVPEDMDFLNVSSGHMFDQKFEENLSALKVRAL